MIAESVERLRLNDRLVIFLFPILHGFKVELSTGREYLANIKCRHCDKKINDQYFDIRLSTTNDPEEAIHLFDACPECVRNESYTQSLSGYLTGALLSLVSQIHAAPIASMSIEP